LKFEIPVSQGELVVSQINGDWRGSKTGRHPMSTVDVSSPGGEESGEGELNTDLLIAD
jgi:hypothetical protein